MKIMERLLKIILVMVLILTSSTKVEAKWEKPEDEEKITTIESDKKFEEKEDNEFITYVLNGYEDIPVAMSDDEDFVEMAFKFEKSFLEKITNAKDSDVVDGKLVLSFEGEGISSNYYFLSYYIMCFIPYITDYFPFQLMGRYGSDEIYQMIIYFEDDLTLQDYKDYIVTVLTTVEYIVGVASQYNSEAAKALFVHDYLVQNTIYDFSVDCYSSAGPLFEGISVCQGYAFAFKYIMNLLDIECHYVSSKSMNHGWNIIKINGQYFHVDVTWDDPLLYGNQDQYCFVEHDYFLVSDTEISKDHYGWDLQLPCNDPTFDDYFWVYVNSPIINDGEYFYFFDNGTSELIKFNHKTQEGEVLFFASIWPSGTGGFWMGCFSGLAKVGERLYFNTATGLYSIKTDGTNLVCYYEPDTSDAYIFGMMYYWYNGKIEYAKVKNFQYNSGKYTYVPEDVHVPVGMISFLEQEIKIEIGETVELDAVVLPYYPESLVYTIEAENGEIVDVNDFIVTGLKNGTTTVTLTADGVSATCTIIVGTGVEDVEVPVLYGDVNGDGEVTSVDRMILARYLAKWSEYGEDAINIKNADVDNDGRITATDRMILARHLAKWTGYELLPILD